jgi:hypothetical protein
LRAAVTAAIACEVRINEFLPSRAGSEESRELALVHKSLQAVKTLGALPPQDELLNDTIQLVDQAMKRAV